MQPWGLFVLSPPPTTPRLRESPKQKGDEEFLLWKIGNRSQEESWTIC